MIQRIEFLPIALLPLTRLVKQCKQSEINTNIILTIGAEGGIPKGNEILTNDKFTFSCDSIQLHLPTLGYFKSQH